MEDIDKIFTGVTIICVIAAGYAIVAEIGDYVAIGALVITLIVILTSYFTNQKNTKQLDQIDKRLDRIERCLNSLNCQNLINSSENIDPENSTSNITEEVENGINDSQKSNYKQASKYAVYIMVVGIVFWILDALINQSLKSVLEWGFPLFLTGVSMYIVVIQVEKQQNESGNSMAHFATIERKLDELLENEETD